MRFIASWLLYATGDLLYQAYSRLMLWSETVQGEGNGPWKEAE